LNIVAAAGAQRPAVAAIGKAILVNSFIISPFLGEP
jgi:hypothetical protein